MNENVARRLTDAVIIKASSGCLQTDKIVPSFVIPRLLSLPRRDDLNWIGPGEDAIKDVAR